MTRQKQQITQEIPANSVEMVAGRVKKDLVYVLLSAVVAMAAGLVVGSIVKF